MSSSIANHPASPPSAATAVVDEDRLVVRLTDGRELSVPIAWFTWLAAAEPEMRRRVEVIEDGAGLWWPELDEGLSVAGLLGVPETA